MTENFHNLRGPARVNAAAAIAGSRRERKPFGNPNAGKHHAARLRQSTSVKWSPVKQSYRPGQTVASRIAGIQAWYDRQAEIAALR